MTARPDGEVVYGSLDSIPTSAPLMTDCDDQTKTGCSLTGSQLEPRPPAMSLIHITTEIRFKGGVQALGHLRYGHTCRYRLRPAPSASLCEGHFE